MNKQFSNQELKKIIIDLYTSNNIIIDDEINKCLQVSSKTNYKKLIKLYDDIKKYIIENMSTITTSTKSNSSTSKDKDYIIENLTFEIKEQDKDLQIENKQLKTELFNINQLVNNFKFKITNYKKIIADLNNKLKYNSNNNTDEDNNIIDDNKEKRNIKYTKLKELSSKNIIFELNKLSTHELKILYNRYFNNKLNRQLFN